MVIALSILSWFIRNKRYAQSIKPPLSGLALKANNPQMAVLTQIQCPGSIPHQEEGYPCFIHFYKAKVKIAQILNVKASAEV